MEVQLYIFIKILDRILIKSILGAYIFIIVISSWIVKGETNNNTIIAGDFKTPLTPMDRSTKQKINKETQTLNDTTDQLDLIDIYRTFHPKTMNFTFFSSAHGTFSRIDHILGHKSSLGKFKKTEIVSSIFSDHNAVRLDLNYRKKKTKLLNIPTYGS